MRKTANQYYDALVQAMRAVEVTDARGRRLGFESGIQSAVRMVRATGRAGRRLYFIGNGASAAIASHQAVDFWKRGGVRAISFNDAALLTCISNDCGYARVFEKPVEMFMEKGDLLAAISSSGESENILRAVRSARKIGSRIITLSGFKPGNRLARSGGDLNFYVPASSYGLVEVTHHSICHCILDIMTGGK